MDARSVGRINARGVSEYEAGPIERNEIQYLGKPPVRSEPGQDAREKTDEAGCRNSDFLKKKSTVMVKLAFLNARGHSARLPYGSFFGSRCPMA